jgi:hypothetical protein
VLPSSGRAGGLAGELALWLHAAARRCWCAALLLPVALTELLLTGLLLLPLACLSGV